MEKFLLEIIITDNYNLSVPPPVSPILIKEFHVSFHSGGWNLYLLSLPISEHYPSIHWSSSFTSWELSHRAIETRNSVKSYSNKIERLLFTLLRIFNRMQHWLIGKLFSDWKLQIKKLPFSFQCNHIILIAIMTFLNFGFIHFYYVFIHTFKSF